MKKVAQFVSEPIAPDPGTADPADMSRGLAGLSTGFTWRDRRYLIREILDEWKRSEAEGGRPAGERYYRRHYYRIRVDTGEIMTLYVVRRVKIGEDPKQRWWLYSIESSPE